MPEKVFVVPEDQLKLNEQELDEEITKVLTANNPNAPKNITRFSYKEKAFKLDAAVEQMAMHFALDGYLIHRESEEYKRMEQFQQQLAAAGAATDTPMAEGGESEDGTAPQTRLRNQFNFSERASQTFNNPPRERGIFTEPPPRSDFSATATQWDIFDSYLEDIERQRLAKEKSKAAHSKFAKGEEEKKPSKETNKEQEDVVHSHAMGRSLKLMERMVNQNTFDDIAQDFKYWEDASDQFREGEGTLLPLWKFFNDRAKKKTVTSICWNSQYSDLFAVSFGSYDFLKQGPGLIFLFSLKNPTYPEYIFTTETGAMCLDFHAQHSSLLAVGLYDGTVCVYDLQHKVNKPIFMSTTRSGKHTDPVWQVSWQEEDLAKNLNFFSISSDGRVTLWTMSKNELQFTDVMLLKLTGLPSQPSTTGSTEAEEEASLVGLAGGCCFDFNRMSDHLFIVGTEEGKIHKCSKAYNSQYLETYEGHHMAVYAARWNPYHPRVFLSCSADWTVKLWDHNNKNHVMSWDLNNAVGDVAWAPFSSTVFAACTYDGKIHVYDLNENKHEPLCEQQVAKKARLTHISFNQHEPVILVGDDRGNVTSCKLSPNLRKIVKVEAKTYRESEVEKLDKILAYVARSGDVGL